jgi:WD40 repeat protein
MEASPRVRKRGVLLTEQGLKKLNTARRQAEKRDNFGDRFTLEELSDRTQLSLKTMAKVLDRKSTVDRQTLDACFCAFNLTLEATDYQYPHSPPLKLPAASPEKTTPVIDWGEAPDVSSFYGRQAELNQLQQWVSHDQCRLVGILGLGGMGKTTLVTKLTYCLSEIAQGVKPQALEIQNSNFKTQNSLLSSTPFTHLIWRSLRNAPTLDTVLSDWLGVLSHQQENQPDLKRLLHHLQQHRCLLVLDNLETLLDSGKAGVYRSGYENYSDLFRLIGETTHQSCLLVTSREKVLEFVPLEGETAPVRCLALHGSAETTQGLLQSRQLSGTVADFQTLGDRYSNSPLAIQLISATIRDLFNGDVGAFLQQDALLFSGLRRLLDQQFERLSALEQTMMIWLAIHRDWVSQDDLLDAMLIPPPRGHLLDALESLCWRSLIEQQQGTYTQQPVIMEYVTERLTERVSQELLATETAHLAPTSYLHRFALLKTTVKDYIRESQSRLVLEPVCRQLQAVLGSPRAIVAHLKTRLTKLQADVPQPLTHAEAVTPSYAPGNLLNLLCHLKADLTGINVSGLAIWNAYLPGVPLPQANFAHAHLRHTVFSNVFSAVFSIAFSPDGTRFATGEIGGFLRLWDLASGQVLWGLKGHRSWVWSLAFSPDGDWLATATGDHVVGLWDVEQGTLVRSLTGHTDQIYSVAFSPEGNHLASASGDGTVRLWHPETGDCLQIFQGHTEKAWSVAFSPDGAQLASGGSNHPIHIWSVETGQLIQRLEGHTDHVYAVAFHPTAPLLASASADKTICLWDLAAGDPLHTLKGHSLDVLSLSFSPDGATLSTSSSDETVRLWEVATGKPLRTLVGHQNWIRSVAFSPQGQTLLSGSSDYSIRLWDGETGQTLKTWQGYSNWVWAAEFSADGKTVLSGSGDRTISLWDAVTGKLQRTLRGHTTWVLTVSFNRNGTLMASAGGKEIHLWDLQSGRILQTLVGHTSQVASLHISPQDDCLISGSSDYTARLWDLKSGTTRYVLQGHTDWIRTVVFSGDGQFVATASHDKTARLWDVATGDCLHCFDAFDAWVWSVDFHPHGHQLAITSGNHLSLWDLTNYQRLQTFQGHSSWIRSVRFSPDGQHIATGGQDGQIRIWDLDSGQTVQLMTEPHSHVLSVRFSPDGQRLVSSSTYETIKIWEVATGQCLHTLKADGLYEGMNIQGTSGLSPGAIATLKQLGAVDS